MASPAGSSAKKQRQAIDIEMKIIKEYEAGKKVQVTASSMGLVHSTVSTILKDKGRVKETAKASVGYNAVITEQRKGLVLEMEKLLARWFDDQIQKRMLMSLFFDPKARCVASLRLKGHEGRGGGRMYRNTYGKPWLVTVVSLSKHIFNVDKTDLYWSQKGHTFIKRLRVCVVSRLLTPRRQVHAEHQRKIFFFLTIDH